MKKTILFSMISGLSLSYSTASSQELLDQYYTPHEMHMSRHMLKEMHGDYNTLFLMADRLEYRSGGDGKLFWDAQAWYGGDKEKVWIKTEGVYGFGEDTFEEADVELLYNRAIAPFFDFQAGIKQDFRNGPDRTYGVIGIQGLAPYWFEVDTSLNISNKGDLSMNFEVEYEILLTQQLILQPHAELVFSFQNVPEIDIGSSFSTFETGLRLRYEIKREFAPYIGVTWHKAFGNTANFARIEGHNPSSVSALIGIRAWY